VRARRAAQAARWLLEERERAAAVRAGAPAAELGKCRVEATLFSVRSAIQAHSDMLKAGALQLAPEVEQRLQALLVDRVAPLLLRTLKMWEGGAQRLMAVQTPLFWPAAALQGRWLGFVACCQARAWHRASWLLPLSCTAGMRSDACQPGGMPCWPRLFTGAGHDASAAAAAS